MRYITEEQSATLVTHELAYNAMHQALIAAVAENAATFPVVHGHASDPDNRFTIKSAADGEHAGLKVGSYFPSNDAADLPRHSSIIFLFDQTKGRIGAVIEGSRLNGYRTAAAALLGVLRRAGPLAVLAAIQVATHALLAVPWLVIGGTLYWLLLGGYDPYFVVATRPPALWGFLAGFLPVLVAGLLLLWPVKDPKTSPDEPVLTDATGHPADPTGH